MGTGQTFIPKLLSVPDWVSPERYVTLPSHASSDATPIRTLADHGNHLTVSLFPSGAKIGVRVVARCAADWRHDQCPDHFGSVVFEAFNLREEFSGRNKGCVSDTRIIDKSRPPAYRNRSNPNLSARVTIAAADTNSVYCNIQVLKQQKKLDNASPPMDVLPRGGKYDSRKS